MTAPQTQLADTLAFAVPNSDRSSLVAQAFTLAPSVVDKNGVSYTHFSYASEDREVKLTRSVRVTRKPEAGPRVSCGALLLPNGVVFTSGSVRILGDS